MVCAEMLQTTSKFREVSLVAGYSPDSNDVSTEADESPLLRSVTRKRLVIAN
jgi:hypothetical protein